MAFRRDPLDRRLPERLAASTVVSLFLHALFAALLFAVLVSSSQEGSTENVQGGEVITIERRTPVVVARQPQAVSAAAPLPHVPRIAPVAHPPISQPERQRLPQNQHELSRFSPTAPPNPLPIPQQSQQPNPQPTQEVFEPSPATAPPAAPVNIPTVAPVAVAFKAPPTAAPSPAPSSRPTARPSPRPPAPTSAPSAKPATPAPVSPTAAPTAVAVSVKASSAPSAPPAPAAHASLPPAQRSGVPSPSPTSAAAVAKTAGTAPSPGPKGIGSPGPVAGSGSKSAPSPRRPVEIRPTPSPVPVPSAPAPAESKFAAKLHGLLPTGGPVNPTTKSYTPHLSLKGRMEPTPPPEILAATKYLYDESGTGMEARIKMWVTSAHKAGPTTICTGWLVRYPQAAPSNYAPVPANDNIAPANGTQVSVGGGAHSGGAPQFDAGMAPIVEGVVSIPCFGRRLVPYAGSAGSSP